MLRIDDTPASEAPASKVSANTFWLVGSRSQSLPSQADSGFVVVVVVLVVLVGGRVVVVEVVVEVVLVFVVVEVRVEVADDEDVMGEPVVGVADGADVLGVEVVEVADWLALVAALVGGTPESPPGVEHAVIAVSMTAARHKARHLMLP